MNIVQCCITLILQLQLLKKEIIVFSMQEEFVKMELICIPLFLLNIKVNYYSKILKKYEDVPEKEGFVRGEILMKGFVAKPVLGYPDKSVVIHVAQVFFCHQ